MTVSYASKVTTNYSFGGFLKLLKRWRGSVYKLVWADLIAFLIIYYILNLTYIFLLDGTSKTYFIRMVLYCREYGTLIPLSFVLGFYVDIVYTRWWDQFTLIPFPDSLAILIGASIDGKDEKSRIVRRTIVRYACVTFTMTLMLMSPKVKKRFPTMKHFVKAGLLSEEEREMIEQIEDEYPSYHKYWLPLAWAASVTTKARHEGIIKEDTLMKGILDELNAFRTKCHGMLDYDWINIPLVYTQVVTLAVYGYFLTTVIGHQFTKDSLNESNTDLLIFSFPFMPIVEFFFYMGWLKVAETLINPFGEDDDDFEVMWMIDRNIQVSYLLVDRIHQENPKLVKDAHWDEVVPMSLPFTVASQKYIKEYPEPSTKDLVVEHIEQDLIVPQFLSKDERINYSPGTQFWKRNGRVLRARRHSDLPLNRIVTSDEDNANETELQELHETEPTKQVTEESSDEDVFEKLRDERIKQHQQKILKYITLLNIKSESDLQLSKKI